jgi:arginyl-tRNA synthetase
VRANADSPEDAKKALEFGAQGIGLTRTEHMFFEKDRISKVRLMILSDTEEERKSALDAILPFQKADFTGIYEVMGDLPVTIRLLDPPLHEFLMGVDFDKTQYESDTYILGKDAIREGLKKGVLYEKDDRSVWIDLTADGLDEKLLLRSDGTSVYMTQDIGTAIMRHERFKADKMIYVVGNEQDYHFEVLKLVLKKLGYEWADTIEHLSYGMVELPHGKMKSREGTVVDADDLMDEMYNTAFKMSNELGKINEMSETEGRELCEMIAMSALKYFILKVDPKKKMMFIPEESIDFNGNTGPFIQYTHARIKSLLRKYREQDCAESSVLRHYERNEAIQKLDISPKETGIIKSLYEYPDVVMQAGSAYSPALIANHIYELAKEYNQFYQDVPILKEPNADLRYFRLRLSELVAKTIKHGMALLGIAVPEKM